MATTKNLSKRQKLHNQNQQKQQIQKQKHNQLASPPQDQVSSTQDQVGPSHDEHDCQTSPLMLITTHEDEHQQHDDQNHKIDGKQLDEVTPTIIKDEEQQNYIKAQHTQSSPQTNSYSPTAKATTTTTTTTTNTTSTSPTQTDINDFMPTVSSNTSKRRNSNDSQCKRSNSSSTTTNKKRKTHNHNSSSDNNRSGNNSHSDHETSSIASWSSASYGASPTSPISSSSSTSSLSSSSSSSHSSSSCASTLTPSPLSSPDIINELRGPRLKLSEEKIRKIKKRPVLFDDYYADQPSFASTPTASSGCSPGQHSTMTQNSDQSSSTSTSGHLKLPTNNMVIHMFQAPPTFVNNLKPCNLPKKPQEPPPSSTPPAPTKEMLNCAICGIKDKPPNISKIYGQNSCLLCTKFFVAFLKRPQQLYCAQDGDCLMTFDSRCQACWIKICLQKFDIEEEHRKVGLKFSPKLLSSPNVSLITIDTSVTR